MRTHASDRTGLVSVTRSCTFELSPIMTSCFSCLFFVHPLNTQAKAISGASVATLQLLPLLVPLLHNFSIVVCRCSGQSILHFHLLHYQKENDVLFVPVAMNFFMFFITPTLWSILFPLSFLSAAFPSNDSETILQMPCTVRQLQALFLPKLLHVSHPSASFFRPVTLFFSSVSSLFLGRFFVASVALSASVCVHETLVVPPIHSSLVTVLATVFLNAVFLKINSDCSWV